MKRDDSITSVYHPEGFVSHIWHNGHGYTRNALEADHIALRQVHDHGQYRHLLARAMKPLPLHVATAWHLMRHLVN